MCAWLPRNGNSLPLISVFQKTLRYQHFVRLAAFDNHAFVCVSSGCCRGGETPMKRVTTFW